MTHEELSDKGYTYASAARALGCTRTHVWLVVNNRRKSSILVARLKKLPSRLYAKRERIAKP